jgi:Bacterial capsule synthesis protein PGA_cap
MNKPKPGMRWVRAFTAKPYTIKEGLGLLWRNLAGASFANPAHVGFGPRVSVLNDIEPRQTLGFGGDVMSMFDRPLSIDASVRAFFADCQQLVLNFEGVITDEPQITPDQKHTIGILDSLSQLAEPSRIVLSLANNHTGDYGEDSCHSCMELLHQRGFATLGVQARPFIDLNEQIRVVTGTQWSNREGKHLAWLRQPEQHVRPGAMNLLYPHWGYELEVFPRPVVVEQMKGHLAYFDAVIGHHSHTPQPVCVMPGPDGIQKPAAYSLGDFCFGMAYKRIHPLKYYVWGLVLKITVGPLKSDPSRWAVGRMEWAFIECLHHSRQKGFEVRLVDQIPMLFGELPQAAA